MKMDALFWSRLHGGATHFPIALTISATLFEAVGFFRRAPARREDFQTIGYWLVLGAGFGSAGAMLSGLILSRWTVAGTGLLRVHHLFVWPAFVLIVGLASWRLAVGRNPSRRSLAVYLAVLGLTCALVGAAGYSGGELLLGNP